MSHPINDSIVDCINDEWDDMTRDLKDWLKSRKDDSIDSHIVYNKLIYLERVWKRERFDSYPDS